MDITRLGPNVFWARVAQKIKSMPNSEHRKMRDEWLAWKDSKNIGAPERKEEILPTPSAGFESANLPKGINLDEIEEHLAGLRVNHGKQQAPTAQQSLFSQKVATLFGAIKKSITFE